jgi:hypothetical protein
MISVERLQTYSPEDAAGLGRLMPFLSESFTDTPVDETLLRTIIESEYHDQLVARLDAKIVGAATLSVVMGSAMGKKGWLEDFVTDPNTGIRGIGQLVWNEMGVWCVENDIDLEFTSKATRLAAHNFYTKQGAKIRNTTVFKKTFRK